METFYFEAVLSQRDMQQRSFGFLKQLSLKGRSFTICSWSCSSSPLAL